MKTGDHYTEFSIQFFNPDRSDKTLEDLDRVFKAEDLCQVLYRNLRDALDAGPPVLSNLTISVTEKMDQPVSTMLANNPGS